MAYKNPEDKKKWQEAKRNDPEWRERRRQYLLASKEQRRVSQRLYRQTHANQIAEYRQRNKCRIKEVRSKYLKDHADELKLYRRNHRAEYREKSRLWAAMYYKAHPEKLWKNVNPQQYKITARASTRAWVERNRPHIQAKIRARKARTKNNPDASAFYRKIRSMRRVRCYYCGCWVSGAGAHIDHVIAIARDGNHASSNLSASCPSCNLKKRAHQPSALKFLPQPLLDL